MNRQLGSYTLLSPLGVGGMGEVYRARDNKLGREVAIKILPPHFTEDPERRDRLRREARLLATLNHPHIGAIYGLEEHDGVTALILELVEGSTLADRLSRGSMPIAQAVAVARQIAEALDEAHEKGIVHRDLKPANIVLQGVPGGDSRVKVLDFGIAKTLSAPDSVAQGTTILVTATVSGQILGTPAYMSPEQARGLPVDRRTDIWAFGCVLFEMLSGRRPFEGATVADTLARILEHDPDWSALPAATPAPIRQLIERCLRKDPRRRLHDIADALLESEGPIETVSLRQGRVNVRERVLWMSACALGTLALVGALTLGRSTDRASIGASVPVKFQIQTPAGSRTRDGSTAPFAIAPDGSSLVFSARSDDDGVVRLWVRSQADGALRLLTGTEGGTYPAWSPDGREIAFSAGDKLKKISAAGGPATDLCDLPKITGASWSTRNEIVVGTQEGLRLVSADGITQLTAVTSVDRAHGETAHAWPQFLPDGRHVLFTSRGARTEVRVLSLDTRATVTLVEAAAKALYASGHLLFIRDTSLVAQPFDPATLRMGSKILTLSDRLPAKRVLRSGDEDSAFSASSNGMLAFAEQDSIGISRLSWLDRAGTNLGSVGGPAEYAFMSLSPDERRVAYVIGADWTYKQGNSIWVSDVAPGSTPTHLTAAPGNYSLLVWSPGADRIAYNAWRGSEVEVAVRGTGSSAREDVLVRSSAGQWVSGWLQDETSLLVTGGIPSTGQTLGYLPLLGDRKPVPFLDQPITGAAAVLSPDGHWIAYHTSGSQFDVYVRPFPVRTNEVYKVSRNGGHNAKWRPGSNDELFYIGTDGRMMSVTIDSTHGFQLRDEKALFAVPAGRPTGGWFQQYDATRDGRFLMIMPDPQLTSLTSSYITGVVNWPALLQTQ